MERLSAAAKAEPMTRSIRTTHITQWQLCAELRTEIAISYLIQELQNSLYKSITCSNGFH